MAGGSPLEMRAMAGDETEEWLDLLGEAFAAKVPPSASNHVLAFQDD